MAAPIPAYMRKMMTLLKIIAVLVFIGLLTFDGYVLNTLYNQYKQAQYEKAPTVVFDKLQASLGVAVGNLQLVILESSVVNAYATNEWEVIITTGMLDFLESEEELAAVLGHEVAHHMLGHVDLMGILEHAPNGMYLNSPTMEAMSDLIGQQFAQMSGYGKCGGYQVWSRILSKGGFSYFTRSHPDATTRVHILKQVCEA